MNQDILDGTPFLDIKPYRPFADRIEEARGGWATEEIRRYEVRFIEASLRYGGLRKSSVSLLHNAWQNNRALRGQRFLCAAASIRLVTHRVAQP